MYEYITESPPFNIEKINKIDHIEKLIFIVLNFVKKEKNTQSESYIIFLPMMNQF